MVTFTLNFVLRQHFLQNRFRSILLDRLFFTFTFGVFNRIFGAGKGYILRYTSLLHTTTVSDTNHQGRCFPWKTPYSKSCSTTWYWCCMQDMVLASINVHGCLLSRHWYLCVFTEVALGTFQLNCVIGSLSFTLP